VQLLPVLSCQVPQCGAKNACIRSVALHAAWQLANPHLLSSSDACISDYAPSAHAGQRRHLLPTSTQACELGPAYTHSCFHLCAVVRPSLANSWTGYGLDVSDSGLARGGTEEASAGGQGLRQAPTARDVSLRDFNSEGFQLLPTYLALTDIHCHRVDQHSLAGASWPNPLLTSW